MTEFEIRSEKERQRYNQRLRRTGYRKVLRHSEFFYAQRQNAIRDELLSHATGRKALELGSLNWKPWLDARGIHPAELHCINISEVELEKGKSSSTRSQIQPVFHLMDANRLEFEDDSFDVVFGNAILHHLEFETALKEVARVLRPDGVAVFLEPLGLNPVAGIVRRLTPFARTEDEKPLEFEELGLLRNQFECRIYYEQFLTTPFGVVSGILFSRPNNAMMSIVYRLDLLIDRTLPFLRPYFRRVLVELRPAHA